MEYEKITTCAPKCWYAVELALKGTVVQITEALYNEIAELGAYPVTRGRYHHPWAATSSPKVTYWVGPTARDWDNCPVRIDPSQVVPV